MFGRTVLFLLINFGGLALGSIYTAEVAGEWYQSLPKAPWTPPGWVFGAAWTTIMICFSIYLSRAWKYLDIRDRKLFYFVFALSWVLNVIWNPIFFHFKRIGIGFIVISILTLFVVRFVQEGRRKMRWEWWLVMPYLIWMIIATSLNGYIFFALR
ncbi:MAG: tryptophan-rich sensory protein [Flavobacteriales bacterium]|nr:tryptophan-rich sensory protein [Flavobacteriales bacterium]